MPRAPAASGPNLSFKTRYKPSTVSITTSFIRCLVARVSSTCVNTPPDGVSARGEEQERGCGGADQAVVRPVVLVSAPRPPPDPGITSRFLGVDSPSQAAREEEETKASRRDTTLRRAELLPAGSSAADGAHSLGSRLGLGWIEVDVGAERLHVSAQKLRAQLVRRLRVHFRGGCLVIAQRRCQNRTVHRHAKRDATSG